MLGVHLPREYAGNCQSRLSRDCVRSQGSWTLGQAAERGRIHDTIAHRSRWRSDRCSGAGPTDAGWTFAWRLPFLSFRFPTFGSGARFGATVSGRPHGGAFDEDLSTAHAVIHAAVNAACKTDDDREGRLASRLRKTRESYRTRSRRIPGSVTIPGIRRRHARTPPHLRLDCRKDSRIEKSGL